MSAAEKIAAARALIEPLTGRTPGPWVADLGETYTVRDRENARLAGCSHLTNFGRRPNDEVAATCRTMAAAPALRDTVAALADLADAQAQEIARLKDENADLKTSVVAFGAVHAVTYAKQWGLPDGHLHPHHYDILEKAGARMVDFTRADLGDAS